MMDISRHQKRARLESLPSDADIRIHPAVADLVRVAEVPYLAGDLSSLTPLAAAYQELVEPVILVRSGRRYFVIGGYRTWTVTRQLRDSCPSLLAVVLDGRVGEDVARAIAVYDLMIHRLISSLDRAGAHHIDRMARAFYPEYQRPAAGRPSAREHQASLIDGFFRRPVGTAVLADVMRVAPSTLRRARIEHPHD